MPGVLITLGAAECTMQAAVITEEVITAEAVDGATDRALQI
jgi:hypothetical protein